MQGQFRGCHTPDAELFGVHYCDNPPIILLERNNGTSRTPSPTDVADSLPCRKIATLFADFTLCYGIEKAVQRFLLRHRFVLITTLYFFFTFSAPLGRLTPIEALPQAPLRALPFLTPHLNSSSTVFSL